jgi:hypothetical protein
MNLAVSEQTNQQENFANLGVVKTIAPWIIWTQCTCFAVLYAIWNYPHTNFVSDTCMVIGASLSIYILYLKRSFFKTQQAIPFWLLVALLVWIVLHLLLFANNFPLQLGELTSIWKRVVIAMIFALGFGMALSSAHPKRGYWILFYIGMMMPALIFLARYWLNLSAPHYGWAVPEYLKLYSTRESTFYMYKTDYVAFCLPALAISLAQLKRNFDHARIWTLTNLPYLFSFLAVLTTFMLAMGGIKNGMAYSIILIAAFIVLVLNTQFNQVPSSLEKGTCWKLWVHKLFMILLIVVISAPILKRHLDQHASWITLFADAKVAMQVDQIDTWKYFGAKGYPLNEFSTEVSPTNYDRIAWGIVGLRLLQENPLGYGIVENSFGYLTKKKWPHSLLLQTHSGWLDLALGIGIPGVILVLSALLFTMVRLMRDGANNDLPNQRAFWVSNTLWVLWALLLLWCTSEISFKIPLIALLFWVTFGVGISILDGIAPRHLNKLDHANP